MTTMNKSAKLMLSLGLLTVLALPLSACNTVAGFGDDVKGAGGHISNSAKETSDTITHTKGYSTN